MEKNEIMLEEMENTQDVIEVVEAIETEDGPGVSGIVLISAVVLGAGFALYKVGKKVWEKCKAKKASEAVEAADDAELCDDENIEDVTE